MPDIALLPRLALFFGIRIDDLFSINREDELERIDHILAHEQLTEQNYTYAKRTLESILREDPDDVGALKRSAELDIARADRDLRTAGRMLERAMESAPLDADIFALYRRARGGGTEIVRSGNDWFIRVCEPYAQKYPQNARLYELLIEAMISMHYFEKAERYITMMQPTDSTAYMRDIFCGDLEAAKGNLTRAKEIWNAIPKTSHKGQYEAGERFSRINAHKQAINCFEAAFQAATPPRDLSALYSLAFLHTKLGQYSEAIEAWERIIRVLASNHGIVESETVDWAKREIAQLKQRTGIEKEEQI